ncbi:MAG: hypothetical protein U1E05_17740 [Patescibacteria group bacterium]|nr:hypothetical protein [Patescibacteria group bacterium]
MDPVSGLKGELFRPLATVMVPGVVAAAPFVAIACERFPSLKHLLDSPVAVSAIVLFGGITAGMLIEDFGSTLEVWLWKLFSRSKEHDEDWKRYLQLKTKDEIVGQRYLRTINLRLKFELAMVPSLICLTIGSNWYNHLYGNVPSPQMFWATVALSIICVYLLIEANSSIVVLADTRKLIIAACREANTSEQSHALEPAARSVSDRESSPPAQ